MWDRMTYPGAQLHDSRVCLLKVGSAQTSGSSQAAGGCNATQRICFTCWEGNAVKLAQDAEVAQRVAVVPGSLAHGAVHVHVGQVHNACRHDLVCGRLHATTEIAVISF